MRSWILGIALLAACDPRAPTHEDSDDPADTDPAEVPAPPEVVPMPVAAQVQRVSVALRRKRATPAEIASVEADPSALAALADAWSREAPFTQEVVELWGEVLHTRSIDLVMPELGPMTKVPAVDRVHGVGDEPLELIRAIVAAGRPFPDILRTDWTVLDPIGMKIWGGHDGDASTATGPTQVTWTDGRPAAGILATNALWARYPSNGANYHRGRAARVAEALLCEDFASRDVPIDPTLDLSDDEAVAKAVSTDPACVSCHQAIDPLAAHFWPLFPEPTPGAVFVSYSLGCNTPYLDLCYPAELWRPELTGFRPLLGLRPPSYFGEQSTDLGTLAASIAEDPRFDACTVRRMAGWMAQRDPHEVPFEDVARWQQAYVQADRDLRVLASTIATDPVFLGADVTDPVDAPRLAGPLMMRPRALADVVADLTGHRVRAVLKDAVCATTGLNCYGDFEALDDPFLGWHVLAGGTDGARALRPVHDPTPLSLLVQRAVAEEAAWAAVHAELSADPADRRLLASLAHPTDAAGARPALADLHALVLGEPVDVDGPEVDALADLLEAALSVRSDPKRAWADVLTALLRSPDVLFY